VSLKGKSGIVDTVNAGLGKKNDTALSVRIVAGLFG
jgi:hypothetical protein